jgi:hypothetical protein
LFKDTSKYIIISVLTENQSLMGLKE